jgi:hypothetical protein
MDVLIRVFEIYVKSTNELKKLKKKEKKENNRID